MLTLPSSSSPLKWSFLGTKSKNCEPGGMPANDSNGNNKVDNRFSTTSSREPSFSKKDGFTQPNGSFVWVRRTDGGSARVVENGISRKETVDWKTGNHKIPLFRFANHLSFCFLLKTVLYGMLYNTAYNFRGIPRLVAVVNLP